MSLEITYFVSFYKQNAKMGGSIEQVYKVVFVGKNLVVIEV